MTLIISKPKPSVTAVYGPGRPEAQVPGGPTGRGCDSFTRNTLNPEAHFNTRPILAMNRHRSSVLPARALYEAAGRYLVARQFREGGRPMARHSPCVGWFLPRRGFFGRQLDLPDVDIE